MAAQQTKMCHVTETEYNWRAVDKRLMRLVTVGDTYEDCCAKARKHGYTVAAPIPAPVVAE